MSMSQMHPHSAILDLFDPLSSSFSPRNAPSPDSDKENSSPPLISDSSFFGRASKHQSPVKLKHRLVDVGDISTDDPLMLAMLTQEKEPDNSMCDDENDTFSFPRLDLTTATPARVPFSQLTKSPNPSPRTPLGDISLDRDMMPVARAKMYRRPPPPSTLVAEASSFSLIIDAVTESGASFACPLPPSPSPDDLIKECFSPKSSSDMGTPQITITTLDERFASTSTPSLNASFAITLEKTSNPCSPLSRSEPSGAFVQHSRASLRPSPQKTSSHDRNRHSIDLQSSFQLQLQSEDASFDLLNDKISFFPNEMEDSSFDMVNEEAKLLKTIESIEDGDGREAVNLSKDKSTSPKQHDQELDLRVHRSSPESSSRTPPTQPRSPTQRSTPDSPISLVFDKKQIEESATSLTAEKPTTTTDSLKPPPSPVSVPPPCSQDPDPSTLCTPDNVRTKVLPLPVPGLRIVKMTAITGHQKSASSSSTSSATSEGSVAVQPNNNASTLAPASPPKARHLSSSMATAPGRISTRSVATAPSAIVAPTRTGTGPRRVAIVESQPQPVNKERGIAGQRTIPQEKANGPRRVVVGVSSVPAAAAPVPKTTATQGIKAPAKYGSNAAVSALPRPVSRLPTSTASHVRPRPAAGSNASGRVGGGLGQGLGNIRRTMPTTRRVAE